MALYDNIDSSIKQRKQKLNNRHIRNLKIMNILNALVMAFLILIDIFLLIKGIFTGMPQAVTILLIIFVVAQIGSLVVFTIKRFARASMITKVGIVVICFLPIIPYFMYLSIGSNIYIACVLARIIGLAALAMLLFNTKVTNDKKTFGVKGVPLAIASGFAFLTIIYILVSTTNRKVIYQYDKMYNGYVVNNVLAGKGDVVIKNDTVAISDGSLKNVSGNLVIPKSVKYISEDAFVDSKITSLTIYSDNIELMNAINNSNIENIYLESDSCKLDVENLNKEIDIHTDRNVVDKYRDTYRKYDYLFVPKVNDNEYYVCYNGTTLPVYIYTEEKSLNEPEKSSLPSSVDGRNILYNGYYVSNDEIKFPYNVSSNTKIACKYSYVYNITYDFNGSEEKELPTSYYDKLGTIELPELEMDGYQFKGWYDVDQYGNYTQKYTKLDNTLNKDVNLKAKFLKEFTVTFDKILLDAEFDSLEEIIYTEEDVVELVNPTREGFTFEGWYLDKNYQVKASTYLKSDTTLYAKWTVNNNISVNDLDITFDNSFHDVSVSARSIDGVNISYKWYDSNDNLVIEDNVFSVFNASDSGEYYALVTLNYNNLVINNIKVYANVNINKAKYDMSGVSLKNTEYIYDGNYHTPSLNGKLPVGIDNIQITYRFEEGAKYVGTSSVVCIFDTISKNYEIPESISANVTITQREVSIDWSKELTFEYDGNIKQPSFELLNVLQDDKEFIDVNLTGASNSVDTHVATITALVPKNGSNIYKNYKLTSNTANLSIEFYIVSKVNYVEGITVSGYDVEYDGQPHLPNVTIIPSGIEAIYSVEPSDVINVGTYNIRVTFKYTDNENEDIGNVYNVVVKITPRVLEVEWSYVEIEFDNEGHVPTPTITNKIDGDEIELVYTNISYSNVGTYTINYLSIKGVDKDNYMLPDGSFEYRITPQVINVDLDNIGFEDATYEYNGKNQYPTVIKDILQAGVLVTYSGYGKDAGEYEVTATFSINSNNYVISDLTKSKTIIVTITPIVATIKWGQTSFDYDGNEHTPSATVNNLLVGDECDVIVRGVGIAVGDNYVAEAISLTNPNYVLPETAITTAFAINAKDYEFDYTFDDIIFDYDGEWHRPVVVIDENSLPAGISANDIIVTYSEGRKDVGVTTVTAQFASNDPSITLPGETTATVTIRPREATVSFVLDNNIYSGEAIYPTATVSNVIGNDIVTVVLENYENNINAGNYIVYAVDTDNSNYRISTPIQCSYEIKKATYDISNIKFDSIEHEYDGYTHWPTLTAIDESKDLIGGIKDGISVSVSYTEGLKNVGTKTVYATFVGSSNYNDIPAMSATIKITPKAVDLLWIGDSFTYNGEIQKPECILTGLVLNDTCDYTLVAQGINVGTYTASIINLTNSNYTLPANSTFEYEIIPATINLGGLSFNSTSKIYDSTVLAPEIVGTIPDNVEISFEGLSSNAGVHTITINFTVGSNYNAIASRTIDVEILQRPLNIEWTSLEAVYTGVLSYPSYKLSNIIPGDECQITVSGGGIDVGEYTITVTGISNDNYDLETHTSVTYTIIPAEYDMSELSFENTEAVYNGSMQRPTLVGTLPNGVSVSFSDGATNVSDGTVTVTATFTSSDENYNAPKPMKATIKILPKELGVTWSNTVFTYDGEKHSPTATLSQNVCQATLSGYGIDAGEYVCEILSLSDSNYTASSSTTFVINKRTYDMSNITFENKTFTYNGSNQQQTITGSLTSVIGLDGISPEIDYYTGTVKNVSDGDVTCTVTFKTSSINYEAPEAMTCVINVTPKVVDINITLDTDSTISATTQSWNNCYSMSITYDGKEHTVAITSNGDVIANDNPQFSIDGTFKNYNGGTQYVFNIISDDSNYVSTYTKLYVSVTQLNAGYWWNNLQANWWPYDISNLDDVVLVYTHKDLGIEYVGEEPVTYGSYYLSYKSVTENVIISTITKSSSTYDIALTLNSLWALIDYLDGNGDGIIEEYFHVYAIDVYYEELGITDTAIEKIISDSYAASLTSATFIDFTANNTSNNTMCTVTGNIDTKVTTSKVYMNHEFKKALKMETLTNIKLDLTGTNYSTIILVTNSTSGYIKVNSQNYQVNSEGVIKLGLNGVTSITITKYTTMDLYGIILI